MLMPCFNPGPFRSDVVVSVLAQPECLELIVADGGSNDGSVQALEALARKHPRLRVISGPDQGPAEALNKAFAIAHGTLIGWLNADDTSPPGALARAVRSLTCSPTAIPMCCWLCAIPSINSAAGEAPWLCGKLRTISY